jgi:heterotetrameric sarcosine oxidase delta subunit
MRLTCPYCGVRDAEEFAIRGAAAGVRPDPNGSRALADFHDYVHLRENPAGPVVEFWYHAAGCRSWLRVQRDTRTHGILRVDMAAP